MSRNNLNNQIINKLADNESIEKGLQTVVANTQENRCDPVIRELAQEVLQEIRYYRERREVGLKVAKVVGVVFGIIFLCAIIGIIVIATRH